MQRELGHSQIAQQDPPVGMRFAPILRPFRGEFRNSGRTSAFIEEFFRLVAFHPGFEPIQVSGCPHAT